MHFVTLITKAIIVLALHLSVNTVFALDNYYLSVRYSDDGVFFEVNFKTEDDPKIIFFNAACTNAVNTLVIYNKSESRIGGVFFAGGQLYALPNSALNLFEETGLSITKEKNRSYSWESPVIQKHHRTISETRSQMSSRATFTNMPYVVVFISDTDSSQSHFSRPTAFSVFNPHSEQPSFGLEDTTGDGQLDTAVLALVTETQFMNLDILKLDRNGIWLRSDGDNLGHSESCQRALKTSQ